MIYRVGNGPTGCVLRRPTGSTRTAPGLDHIAFASKAELAAAAVHLDDLGITHELIKDIGASYILEFRDPDNIALELTSPK